MIVITAPSGDIGHRVVSSVLAANQPVRLIARHPDRLTPEVRERAEIVAASHSDRAVLERAFDDASALFWLVPSASTATSAAQAYVDFSRPAAELLRNSTISHVVSVSALGRGWQTDAGHVTASLQMDDLLASTGVNFTSLACGSLMSNIARQVDQIRQRGFISAPTPPDLRLPYVAPSDVSEFGARRLLTLDWTGQHEIPMLGPDDLSFDEIAAIVSDVLDRPVRFVETTMAETHEEMIRLGTSPGLADAMVAMLEAKNAGLDHLVERRSQDVANTPTTFREWCESDLVLAFDA